VHESGGMNELEAFCQLVNNVLFVKVVQKIFLNSVEKIAFHVLKKKVKNEIVVGLDDLFEFDDIFMLGQFLKVANFTVSPLGIDFILKGRKHLFEGKDLISFFILNFPNVAIGA
jgi:hypothetical protein